MTDILRQTPLTALHEELGARMVAFAGYTMPVQYRDGVLAEHRWTRASAGLFDVSHMGQARLRGSGAAAALETLVSGDISGLGPHAQRYTLLLNEAGGIRDDLMVSRPDADGLFLVVNAAVKEADFAHIAAQLRGLAELEPLEDRALLALQGPAAAGVLAELAPETSALAFMEARAIEVAGEPCLVSRSGYTGEDGFEISLSAAHAESLARLLLARDAVRPIGLGARDSLRLEAGLCLYGHDIDETTSPVEADLLWALPPSRRARGDFPGAARILRELAEGPARKRVGLAVRDKAPVREGARITTAAGEGVVTSGGFAPTLGAPIAMGYVPAAAAAPGTRVEIELRGRALPAEIVKPPFTPHRYHRRRG
jgi:aminomethyltransferase